MQWTIFFVIDIRKMKVWLRPFPLHKHRGTPTGLWGHWLSCPCHCLCVTQLFTHSPRPWTHWSPSTHENQTRPWHVRLCVAFTYPGFSKKTLVCSTPLWSQCTQQEWWRHSGNFFTHFFGLILQSLLKPICLAHLIGNSAFILIASQFKRGLRQTVPWSERA